MKVPPLSLFATLASTAPHRFSGSLSVIWINTNSEQIEMPQMTFWRSLDIEIEGWRRKWRWMGTRLMWHGPLLPPPTTPRWVLINFFYLFAVFILSMSVCLSGLSIRLFGWNGCLLFNIRPRISTKKTLFGLFVCHEVTLNDEDWTAKATGIIFQNKQTISNKTRQPADSSEVQPS